MLINSYFSHKRAGAFMWVVLCLRWEHESKECFLYLRCNDVTYWISEVKGEFCVLSTLG